MAKGKAEVRPFRVVNISKSGEILDLNHILSYETTKVIVEVLGLVRLPVRKGRNYAIFFLCFGS